MCNSLPAQNAWVWKEQIMLTCHPNTGAAKPHRSGDRSAEPNVKPPPAPGLLGSSSSCLIHLLHADHIVSPLPGLCQGHVPFQHLADDHSSWRHNRKLVFCQPFWWWKGTALSLNLSPATVCCLCVGRRISQTLTVANRWCRLAWPASSHSLQLNIHGYFIFKKPKISSIVSTPLCDCAVSVQTDSDSDSDSGSCSNSGSCCDSGSWSQTWPLGVAVFTSSARVAVGSSSLMFIAVSSCLALPGCQKSCWLRSCPT